MPEEIAVIKIPATVTVKQFAESLALPVTEVIKELMKNGIMATINQEIDFETATIIAEDLGKKIELDQEATARTHKQKTAKEILAEETTSGSKAIKRPPIVTVMGHVDHGKTKLLDTIRKTKVVETESGGITQHIGAYQTNIKGKTITFLDTPGHEAFTAMRKRGAGITDIALLVVAADDGVKPQTIEAVEHAKNAGVPIVVAINKIDKPEANPDKVKKELSEIGVVTEEWGGATVAQEVSALDGTGIDELLDMILLVADMEELKADPKRKPLGTAIEVKKTRGGIAATLIIQDGTLRIGDYFVLGKTCGRVRSITNHLGESVKKAGPSEPVQITGLDSEPQVGDILTGYGADAAKAKSVAGTKKTEARENEFAERKVFSLKDMSAKLSDTHMTHFNVLVKADVEGSAEAIKASLEAIKNDELQVRVLKAAPGKITESDIATAKAASAIIYGFRTVATPLAKQLADKDQVEIKSFEVIYDLIEDVKAAAGKLLAPELEEVSLGKVKLLKIFKTTKKDMIIGGKVLSGKVVKEKNTFVKNPKDGSRAHIVELQCEKTNCAEVIKGKEAGMRLDAKLDLAEGDLIDIVTEISKQRQL